MEESEKGFGGKREAVQNPTEDTYQGGQCPIAAAFIRRGRVRLGF